ncbi:hypothetical protein [Pseudomonas sp. HY13-MNA-CIBAN-0226]|uniref:hypothetical protein n=1 Tax=Pseudomonas sp. HY13-MNA-CIBAN-0226 TaxID=3140473 RepID=UPI003322719B
MNRKMREEFEQFVIRRDGNIWVTVIGEQRSYNEPIERDFELWQASREALVIDLPPAPLEPEEPEEAIDDSHMDAYYAAVSMRNACANAIEAAGLKVKP